MVNFINDDYNIEEAIRPFQGKTIGDDLVNRTNETASSAFLTEQSVSPSLKSRKITKMPFSFFTWIKEIFRIFKITKPVEAIKKDFDVIKREVLDVLLKGTDFECDPSLENIAKLTRQFVAQVKAELFLQAAVQDVAQGEDIKRISASLNEKNDEAFEDFLKENAGDLNNDQKTLFRLFRTIKRDKKYDILQQFYQKTPKFKAIATNFTNFWLKNKKVIENSLGREVEDQFEIPSLTLPENEEIKDMLRDRVKNYLRDRFDANIEKYADYTIVGRLKAHNGLFGSLLNEDDQKAKRKLLKFDCRVLAEEVIADLPRGAKQEASFILNQECLLGLINEVYNTEYSALALQDKAQALDRMRDLLRVAKHGIAASIRYNIGEVALKDKVSPKDALRAAEKARNTAIQWWLREHRDLLEVKSILLEAFAVNKLEQKIAKIDLHEFRELHESKQMDYRIKKSVEKYIESIVNKDFEDEILNARDVSKNPEEIKALAWAAVYKNADILTKVVYEGAKNDIPNPEIDSKLQDMTLELVSEHIKDGVDQSVKAFNAKKEEQLIRFQEWGEGIGLQIANELIGRLLRPENLVESISKLIVTGENSLTESTQLKIREKFIKNRAHFISSNPGLVTSIKNKLFEDSAVTDLESYIYTYLNEKLQELLALEEIKAVEVFQQIVESEVLEKKIKEYLDVELRNPKFENKMKVHIEKAKPKEVCKDLQLFMIRKIDEMKIGKWAKERLKEFYNEDFLLANLNAIRFQELFLENFASPAPGMAADELESNVHNWFLNLFNKEKLIHKRIVLLAGAHLPSMSLRDFTENIESQFPDEWHEMVHAWKEDLLNQA